MLEFSILFTEENYVYLVIIENKRKRHMKMTKEEFGCWLKNKMDKINKEDLK